MEIRKPAYSKDPILKETTKSPKKSSMTLEVLAYHPVKETNESITQEMDLEGYGQLKINFTIICLSFWVN